MNRNDEEFLWPAWPDFLRQKERFAFIAQGTLINKHSIGTTLGNANLHGPVLALGVRRIFNFALQDENYDERGGRYQRSAVENHCATLNIVQTSDSAGFVNGILFSIEPEDIDALAEREFGYDIVPVDYRLGNENGSAYMFIARKASGAIGHRVRDDILPNESSLSTCIAGAATYGKEFLDTWLQSCYLANETPLMGDSHYKTLAQKLVTRFEHLLEE